MTDKKRVYKSEVMALPPLRLVLGDVPSPDPDGRRKVQNQHKTRPEMEFSVIKLIAHLKENEK